MNAGNTKTDPWPKILELLGQCCPRGNAASRSVPTTNLIRELAREACAGKPYRAAFSGTKGFEACVTINVLELTESSATIGWYDPTRCRYEDQRWRRFKARRAGVCAMTGSLIEAGADIFRPVSPRGALANADAMILARALQRLGAADSDGDAE
jgi:Domain of unknown function (DUF3331)